MIISASRRTDIPAFYADWFMNRVRDGYFYRINPFNSKQVTGFSLKAEDVDAICFWTKNPRTLMSHLTELDERGLNYYFQFTLNSYDKTFEPALPPLLDRIETMIELSEMIGPERVIWRYDPVILTSATPVTWHLDQAEQLAFRLKNATRRLMFSFYDYYGKGQGRLHAALQGSSISLTDITSPDQSVALERIARGFKEIADRHDLQIFTCSEAVNLSSFGIEHGACIDGQLIQNLFGVTTKFGNDKGQRKCCGCVESADMGIYNSCRFRCAYCYANFNELMIEKNVLHHNPDSPLLFGSFDGKVEIRTGNNPKQQKCSKGQQELF
jgi:DNA repair photolyase